MTKKRTKWVNLLLSTAVFGFIYCRTKTNQFKHKPCNNFSFGSLCLRLPYLNFQLHFSSYFADKYIIKVNSAMQWNDGKCIVSSSKPGRFLIICWLRKKEHCLAKYNKWYENHLQHWNAWWNGHANIHIVFSLLFNLISYEV